LRYRHIRLSNQGLSGEQIAMNVIDVRSSESMMNPMQISGKRKNEIKNA